MPTRRTPAKTRSGGGPALARKTAPLEKTDLPTRAFASRKAFSAWLAKHHGSSKGIWLRIAKKDAGVASVSYAEAVEVALCFGWIDGQRDRLDESHFLQRFTPRGPRSIWSKINREKVAALIASGEMQPPGLRAVEAAKADGRWDAAYDSPKDMQVPEDFLDLLRTDAKAQASFDALNKQNRYAIAFRLHHAKKPETRARRLAQFFEMMKRGETFHG